MSNLERLKKSYNDRLINLKYNYASELLENISDSTYSELLETYEDLFAPISSDDADDYLRQPDVLDNIIKLLETTIQAQQDVDLKRQDILNTLENLKDTDIDDIVNFIASKS